MSSVSNSSIEQPAKRQPYEQLRLLREQTHIKTITKEIVGRQCIFFYSKNWVFDFSLDSTNKPWDITKQVYFRNARKHKTLAFALPYVVIELVFEGSPRFLRAIVIYGEDITKMIGSMDHFIKREEGICAWVEQPDFNWQPSSIVDLSNQILKENNRFAGIQFYQYHEPFHAQLTGTWEVITV